MLKIKVSGTIEINNLGRDVIKAFAAFNKLNCLFDLRDTEQECFDKVYKEMSKHHELEVYLMILEFKYIKKHV